MITKYLIHATYEVVFRLILYYAFMKFILVRTIRMAYKYKIMSQCAKGTIRMDKPSLSMLYCPCNCTFIAQNKSDYNLYCLMNNLVYVFN